MGFIDIRVNGVSLILSSPTVQLVKRGFALENEIVLGSYTAPMNAPVCFENEQIFRNKYLLESENGSPVIENADLYIGGVLESRGYILLLNATSKFYRFSFIYRPIRKDFFNEKLRDLPWDNGKFFKGDPAPKTYGEFMDFLQDVAVNADAYIPGGSETFALPTLRCPYWNELPEGINSFLDWENSFDGRRRLNVFNAAAGQLVRNQLFYYQENTAGGTGLDIDFTYSMEIHNEQKICPFIYTAFLLEEIWKMEGWKVAGSLFEHDNFLRDLQINNYALDRFAPCAAMRLEWDNTSFVVGNALPLKLNYAFENWYNDTTKLFNIPGSILTVSGPIPCVVIGFYVDLTFLVDITGKFVEIGLSPTGGGYHYTASGIGVGNTVRVNLFTLDLTPPGYRGIFTDYDFAMEIKDTDIPIGDQTLSDASAWMWMTETDGSYYHSNILDNRVEYKNHIPDMTSGEFIKSVIKRFGCSQEYDFATKTVYYNVIRETVKDKSAQDITHILVKDSYEKEILNFFTQGKYSNILQYSYDASSFKVGVMNAFIENYLFDIPGTPLQSLFQGNYKVPYWETTGASKDLNKSFDQGMIYLHYKGMQPGNDGLYPSPHASADNILSDGSTFNEYKMDISYIIPFYWGTYLRAKANPVRFNLMMNVSVMNNLNLFKLITANFQKYFAEEMIVEVEEKGITNCEIKVYQL